jgi:beta-galactosidase
MQASALPYTDEQLNSVEYSVDLPPSNATVLMLDARTLGVGSSSCGPHPLERYIIWSDPTEFSYLLRVLPAGQNNFSAASRVAASNPQP